MIYPDNFESKIGFDRVRLRVKEFCTAKGAVSRAENMSFCTDFKLIESALHAVDEMMSLDKSEVNLPSYDC